MAWCQLEESNPVPSAYKAAALPYELSWQFKELPMTYTSDDLYGKKAKKTTFSSQEERIKKLEKDVEVNYHLMLRYKDMLNQKCESIREDSDRLGRIVLAMKGIKIDEIKPKKN